MQTKKIGCKQKTKTCHDANKKDRMQTKKIGCKQKRSDANKKDRMQTEKIGCKQKTKTCHDASSSLSQLTLSLATFYKLQIMILKSWWTEALLMGLIGRVYTKYSQPRICFCPFDIIPFSFQFADPFCLHPSFLFASDLFCLHAIFFVCIQSFLFAAIHFLLYWPLWATVASTVQNWLYIIAIQNNFEQTIKSGRRYVYLQLPKLLDCFSSSF